MDQYFVPVVLPTKDVLIAEFTLAIDSCDLTLNLKFPAHIRAGILALLDSGKARITLNEMEDPLNG